MNRIVGVPGPSQFTTDVMYATHGVTMTSTSNGCVAHSSGRLAASRAPTSDRQHERDADADERVPRGEPCLLDPERRVLEDLLGDLRGCDRDERLDVGDADPRLPQRDRGDDPDQRPQAGPLGRRWPRRRAHRPDALMQQAPQSRLGGEELGVVLQFGRAGTGQVDALDADHVSGPGRQHDDAVGQVDRLGERVRDEQHGGVERLAQAWPAGGACRPG